MKILLATGIFPPDIGGPATYSKLLADRLPAAGIEVAVQNFGTVKRYPKGIRHLVYLTKLLWHGRDADAVFAQDTVSVGLPALCAAFILGKAFMVRVPGDYAWEQAVQRFGVTDGIDGFQHKRYGLKVEILRRIQKLVVGRADRVIAPSRYFAALVSGWVKDPAKVVAIYNGIDLSETRTIAASGAFIPKTIVSAGRLVPWKGFAMLVRVMKKLPDWKLKIVGDGPDKAYLEKIVVEEGMSSRVALVGSVKRAELLTMIASAEIFALNTSFESFSFQVVEALAVGTPVITTRIGNLSEIVEDGISGILIRPDDEAGFLAAVGRISSDVQLRKRFINEGKKEAQSLSIAATVAAVKNEFLVLKDLHLRPGNKRFIAAKLLRYLFSGGIAAATDLILLYVFTNLCHIWYLVSSVLAFLVAFGVSFVLQKFFTFQDHGMKDVRGQALVYLLVTGTNLLLNTGLIYLFVQYTGMNYIMAQIVTSILIAVESFLVYQAFIFKK